MRRPPATASNGPECMASAWCNAAYRFCGTFTYLPHRAIPGGSAIIYSYRKELKRVNAQP